MRRADGARAVALCLIYLSSIDMKRVFWRGNRALREVID
jgi:hypothetical protein